VGNIHANGLPEMIISHGLLIIDRMVDDERAVLRTRHGYRCSTIKVEIRYAAFCRVFLCFSVFPFLNEKHIPRDFTHASGPFPYKQVALLIQAFTMIV